MDKSRARRAAPFLPPLLIGLVSAQHAAANIRTVDFLLVLAAGALIGVGLMGLIQVLRSRDPQHS